MGLLDQLWDETVAGPRPDHGFGKLRKYSFSPSSSSAAAAADVAPAVTRSITIARPPSLSVPSGESSSVPSPFAAALIGRDRICDVWIHGSSMKMGQEKHWTFCFIIPCDSSSMQQQNQICGHCRTRRVLRKLVVSPEIPLVKLMFYLKLYVAATTATPRGDGWRAFRRKSKMANVDVRAEATVGPRSPTVYDWVVISSLDR